MVVPASLAILGVRSSVPTARRCERTDRCPACGDIRNTLEIRAVRWLTGYAATRHAAGGGRCSLFLL